MQSDGFRALHVSRSGQFLLQVPPDRAFPYFSPEGERAWAPGWEPEYLHPAHGQVAAGMVFRTAAGGEPTLWLVARWDPAAREAEYFRVAPTSRMGTVRVRCASSGPNATMVHVAYDLTALSEAGNETLTKFTDAAFAAMMEEWQTLVGRALISG